MDRMPERRRKRKTEYSWRNRTGLMVTGVWGLLCYGWDGGSLVESRKLVLVGRK